MKTRRNGKTGYLAAKMDMSKAYDRIEWSYLKGTMRTMGFSDRWISLVMNCVSSVTYSVVVNGKQCGWINPSRGLRQGDPLSLYLFLLCAEGFSSLLKVAAQEGSIQGIAAAKHCPRISHLFFTDDSLLLCRAKRKDCNKVVEILKLYENASGQVVNMDKFGIFFSANTCDSDKDIARNILGIQRIMENDNYLGLPLMIGMSKCREFRTIKKKIWSRIKGWGGRLLSRAGKAIMIQAVAQAIPLYVMSYFKLPKSLLCEINMLFANN